MNARSSRAEGGFTGLELVIVVVFVICAGTGLILLMEGGRLPDWNRTFPGGVVAESAYLSGDNLQPFGSVYGFSSVNCQLGSTSIVFPVQDQRRLGAARVVVSLFIGDTGAIDMSRARIYWNRQGGSDEIPRVVGTVLTCPGWLISNKFNLLPGRTADADDWLEPNEQFELTICPATGIPPYSVLSLTIRPDGVGMPLTISRTAPARIEPVMNLG